MRMFKSVIGVVTTSTASGPRCDMGLEDSAGFSAEGACLVDEGCSFEDCARAGTDKNAADPISNR
ncbi:MAG: hypothetical protein V4579_01605 [Pseudomonadota bacterium]